MNRLLLIFTIYFLSSASSIGQNIANYAFTAQSGTYTALSTTNSTLGVLSSGTANEGLYNNIPIGFDFFYLNTRHNSLSASTNGWLALTPGSITSSTAANNLSSISAPTNLLAPLWDDLDLSSGDFRYQTSGTAPNRIFTAEWSNVEWNWNTNTSVISFQVKLTETTGAIQFEYKQEAGAVSGASASIGIRGLNASTALGFQSLNGTGLTPASSTSSSTNTLNTKPATGQIYRFTPGTINAPISFSTTNATINSMRINWNDNVSNESGYVIYRSTDNINFSFIDLIPANSNTYVLSNLASGTTFFYRVFALNEGRLSNALTGSGTTLIGTLSGTLNIPGNYNSITAALNALRSSGMAGSVVLQLNPTYNSSLETYPINVSNIGTSSTRTLTIRPASNVSSLTISSTINNAAFNISNTNFFILDGRPGGTGSTRALTVTCPNGSNTVLFDGDCNNDTIRFCRLSLNDNGTGGFLSSSVITFSSITTPSVSGTNNNGIVNNEIFGINPPSTLINFSVGIFTGSPVVSQNNVFNNNIMYDYLGNQSFFASNSAIFISGFVNQFTVSGNSIYQTASVSTQSGGGIFTFNAIKFSTNNASNHTISNNFIGGSAPLCVGNAWEVGPVSELNSVIPIDVSVGSTTSFNITGNTIRNFFIGSSFPFFGVPAFVGIQFASQGKSSNVLIDNNSIGDETTSNSINTVNEGNNTTLVFGITAQSADSSNITINNNRIGSFNLTGTGNNDGVVFTGITLTGSGTISNNLIGSTSNENSIRTISAASNSNQAIYGINNATFPGSSSQGQNINISNNTISGMRNNFSGSSIIDRIVGIDIAEANTLTIQNNTIQNLTSSNAASNINAYTLKGIQVVNNGITNASGYTISTNTIRNLNNLNTSGICNMAGLFLNSISNNKNIITRNFIHSFSQTSPNNNSNMTGILLIEGSTRVTNNMIRLGINAAGTSMAAPININCLDNNSSDDVEVWHNSFFMGGSLSNSTASTFCIKRNSNGNFNLANNALVNNRFFTSGTIRRNFAVGISTINQFSGRNNCYFYSGAGTALAQIGSTNYDSILPWRAASAMDDGSGRVNPNFVNATGNVSTVDLHVSGTTPIESNGVAIPIVTVDFDGQTRITLTPNDIGADAGIFTSTSLPVKWKTFTVAPANNNSIANIQFATSQEINNKEFSIEKSSNGINYSSIKTMAGKGNSNLVNNYFYADDISNTSKEIRILYYRIKQTDFDGTFTYSQVQKVDLDAQAAAQSFSVFPNPSTDKIYINGLNSNETTQLYIYNINGQEVMQWSIEANTIENAIDISTLPKGMYIIGFKGSSEKLKLLKN